jgi:hypothetical protein
LNKVLRGHLKTVNILRCSKGYLPILTEFAVEIAPGRSHGETHTTGEHMQKRLFFNGFKMNGTDRTIHEAIIPPPLVFTNLAKSPLPFRDHTSPRAEMTPNAPASQGAVIEGFSPPYQALYRHLPAGNPWATHEMSGTQCPQTFTAGAEKCPA